MELLYAEDVSALRVRVARVAYHTRCESITIPDFGLYVHDGRKALRWRAKTIHGHLGVDLSLTKSSVHLDLPDVTIIPRRQMLRANEHLDALILSNVSEDWKAQAGFVLERDGRECVCPRTSSTVGSFDLKAVLTEYWSEPLGNFEATIPVEYAR